MFLVSDWKDYEIIDLGHGEKLERWGDIILRRPEPQVIWPASDELLWKKAHAHFQRKDSSKGSWQYFQSLPEEWNISYKDLVFHVKPMGLKHTGLFPEQAVNWSWMIEKIRSRKEPVKVLNLFAYTGGATVAAAYAGAEEVCHVDASKGMISWAKENIQLSGLEHRKVRFIVDDVVKFVQREIRRGRKYDGIIMDPPSFGRGPNGEIWKIENELYGLVELCSQVLSPNPLFFLINSYTTALAPAVLHNILTITLNKQYSGKTVADGVGLPVTGTGQVLPCGASGRWESIE
ncbi:MAG: SAM-dependent methyltransferase [Clostridiales bacterium]|nr:SAM-dependent methyltransferase [Clostridiales bacterium]